MSMHLPCTPAFLLGSSLPLIFLCLLPLSCAGGQGVGASASSLHLGSAAPSSSPASAWGPSQGRQSSASCPGVGPCRKGLLQHGGPPALPAKLLQRGLFSLHGPTGPASSLLQRGLSTGSQPALDIRLLQRGVLHGLQVEICSISDLHGLQPASPRSSPRAAGESVKG